MNEKFGISEANVMDEIANGIWQCPEVMTCQVICMLHDNRKADDSIEEFNLFFFIADTEDWRKELHRICNTLGYQECGVRDHFIRSATLDSYSIHVNGTVITDGRWQHAE